MNFEKYKFLIAPIVILLLILILLIPNIYTVKTGEVAIISTFGRVTSVQNPGLHMKGPFVQTKTRMEVREKIYDFTKQDEYGYGKALEVSTKDIQSVVIELTVQASIEDPEKLFKDFNGDHEFRFIRPRVRELTQAIISQYTIEEFVSKRSEISNIIYEKLKKDFSPYGIKVSNISIVNHDFSDEYELAIENKKIAEQEVERAKAVQQKLVVEAENKVKLAEYQLKETELKAKANLVLSNSLTNSLLMKMKIEKWDGVLPKVMGNNQNILGSDFLNDKTK